MEQRGVDRVARAHYFFLVQELPAREVEPEEPQDEVEERLADKPAPTGFVGSATGFVGGAFSAAAKGVKAAWQWATYTAPPPKKQWKVRLFETIIVPAKEAEADLIVSELVLPHHVFENEFHNKIPPAILFQPGTTLWQVHDLGLDILVSISSLYTRSAGIAQNSSPLTREHLDTCAISLECVVLYLCVVVQLYLCVCDRCCVLALSMFIREGLPATRRAADELEKLISIIVEGLPAARVYKLENLIFIRMSKPRSCTPER